MSENIRIYFHPQPDEMTFEQSVMHVRRTMYWSGAKWCDISHYPLGQWKLLEEQLKAAHGREMEQLEEKNKELVCKLMTLESEFMDWIGQYDPTDAYVRKAQEENGKLRELVRSYYEYLDQDRCTGCVTRTACDNHLVGECWLHAKLEEMAAELGVAGWKPAGQLVDVPMHTYEDALEDLAEISSINESLESENKRLIALLKELYEDAWWEYPQAFESNYADRLAEFGINAFLDGEDDGMKCLVKPHRVKAGKPCRCTWCGKLIEKGEEHWVSTWVDDVIFTQRECDRCQDYVREMFDGCKTDFATDDKFFEFMQDEHMEVWEEWKRDDDRRGHSSL